MLTAEIGSGPSFQNGSSGPAAAGQQQQQHQHQHRLPRHCSSDRRRRRIFDFIASVVLRFLLFLAHNDGPTSRQQRGQKKRKLFTATGGHRRPPSCWKRDAAQWFSAGFPSFDFRSMMASSLKKNQRRVQRDDAIKFGGPKYNGGSFSFFYYWHRALKFIAARTFFLLAFTHWSLLLAFVRYATSRLNTRTAHLATSFGKSP